MKTGCEFVKCVLLVNGKCESKANTCEYRTDEERVEELESMVDGLQAEKKRLRAMLNLNRNGHDTDCRQYKYGNNYECTCGKSVKP